MEAMNYRLVVVLYLISINFVPIGSDAKSNWYKKWYQYGVRASGMPVC